MLPLLPLLPPFPQYIRAIYKRYFSKIFQKIFFPPIGVFGDLVATVATYIKISHSTSASERCHRVAT